MSKIAIKNATVVNEGKRFQATVFICDKIIEKIDCEQIMPTDGYRVIDATGQYLLPGVIDNHVHFREPGMCYKADFASESRAAVAGGVTSVMEMPNTQPTTITRSLLEDKVAIASEKSLCNYSFYLGATNNNLDEILASDPQSICGLKVFMGSSTGNMLVDDAATLETIFKESPLRIVVHCEEESEIQANTKIIKEMWGDMAPPFTVHPQIRTSEACFRSTEKAVRLAEKFDTQLHIAHVSTSRELALFSNDLPLAQKKITGEACVQHLWFCDEAYERLGGKVKCNPAIKTVIDRDDLREALNNNVLDLIATDHAPHTLEEKMQPYFQCPSGIPLIQHALPAMLALVERGVFTLETVVQKMCHNPATLFRVEQRGFIREGYFADLVLVKPNTPQKVSTENILYRCGWSPFEGITFRHSVTHTLVNGNLVWENGQVIEESRGERLRFF